MDALTESLKQVVKEAVSEALRETLREFQLPKPTQVVQQNTAKPAESKKLAVKIDEAAEMLSLSTATVRRLVANGSLKVSRKTRHLLIPIEEIKRMMDI